ncbi:MAG: alkaline phosphatase family protein [Roseiflexaceae bacterium]|nr:alkaline phosphatase family protein [Roseiflexaceae bacterium]
MINQESLDAVAAGRLDAHFLRPSYDAYSFAQIPNTVASLLTGEPYQGVPFGPRQDLISQYDTVILLFIDSFGWRFFEQYADRSPFLQRIVRDGLASKLTAQFPSTTAVHVTTIHSGLPLSQHGVCEWYHYEPQLDAVIAPLLFSFAGDERETLKHSGIAPADLYPTPSLYGRLAAHAVPSFVLHNSKIAGSTFSTWATRAAQTVPYNTLPEALTTLAQLVGRNAGPAYYFLYWEAIDSTCHVHGPDSAQAQAEIELFLLAMEHILHPQLARQPGRTLLLLSADHGHTAIDPATTVYLNHSLPALAQHIRRSRDGRLLVPAGSSRDMFLHIKPGQVEEAQSLLLHHLAGRADVRRVAEMLAQGFFGPLPASERLLGRIGDLVILPYANETVWWYERDRFDVHFRGMHGGLTPNEMETLLLALPYG